MVEPDPAPVSTPTETMTPSPALNAASHRHTPAPTASPKREPIFNPLAADPSIHPDLKPLFDGMVRVLVWSEQVLECHARLRAMVESCGLPKPDEWPGSLALEQRRAKYDAFVEATREEHARLGESVAVGGDEIEPPWTVLIREWSECYREWCGAIAASRQAAGSPLVAAIMNAGEAQPAQRWTTQAVMRLDALAGSLHPSAIAGPDGLGIIRSGVPPLPADFAKSLNTVRARVDELRAIPTTVVIDSAVTPPEARQYAGLATGREQQTMSRSVWDDLREDAREFAKRYPTAGHTLVFVPDRTAEGASLVDVHRRAHRPGHSDALQAQRAREFMSNPAHIANAIQMARDPQTLAELFAAATDYAARLRGIVFPSAEAWITELRQDVASEGRGFVAEWTWLKEPQRPCKPALSFNLVDETSVLLRLSDGANVAPCMQWKKLCEDLWTLSRESVGSVVHQATRARPDLPTIGEDPSTCYASRLLHWLAWSGRVTGLRADVNWRLSFVSDDERELVHSSRDPSSREAPQPFMHGYPEQPPPIPGKPWLHYAGWWWSTIKDIGAAIVAAVDFLKPADPAIAMQAAAVPQELVELVRRLTDVAVPGGIERTAGRAAVNDVPTRVEVVLWEGAAHTDRNIRLARTRTAYLEENGNVANALAALKAGGNEIGKSTFYDHLNALDRECPGWRASVLISGPSGNLENGVIARSRGKSRGKVR